ncbi:MAG: MATE family efflux transporter [Psychromonas sp.]
MQQARFLQGSILKHVMTMSVTNAVGLSAIFLVDLVDIYFISLLNDNHLTAAIGYASALMFFTTAVSIALVTTNSAKVGKAVGLKNAPLAKRYISHLSLYSLLTCSFLCVFIWFFTPELLRLIGAEGQVLIEATTYLRIILPSFPILALAMQMGATLRSLGDGRRAMYGTLAGSLINAILDPIFIFTFNMDLQGAAIASAISRCCVFVIAFYFVCYKYKMFTLPNLSLFKLDISKISLVAIPATLTQIATPLGNLYVTYEVAKFGTEYVAGWAVIGRLIPVAFSVMFAISGAIGPIISQNYGALQISRVRAVLNESLKFVFAYTLVISLFLSMSQDHIVTLFNAQAQTAELIRIFCQYISISFIFTGITFVTMAFLNNLGYQKHATLLNLGKVSLGTVPFVAVGAFYFQAPGILYGQALGTTLFGFISLITAYKILNTIENKHKNNTVGSKSVNK